MEHMCTILTVFQLQEKQKKATLVEVPFAIQSNTCKFAETEVVIKCANSLQISGSVLLEAT